MELNKYIDHTLLKADATAKDIRDNLRSYIFKNTKRNPMILPIIMEV